MPRRVSWEERAVHVDAATADAVLEGMKSFSIDKSQTMACTICLVSEHKMLYRLLACASDTCCQVSAAKCRWRGKIVTCLETDHASIYEYGCHDSVVASPKRKKTDIYTEGVLPQAGG
ncbi:hypothetical protein F444_22145 [Phytophthora nicotianae P1976]|uniref:Uncharacterized protein n=2 Tax=Phytophthora nicotianae TaxID=4792 RepID=A0A080YYP3_PHYNI|nr:hypothetical protein F444_22145 [Phytophthora nicotianae P1976]